MIASIGFNYFQKELHFRIFGMSFMFFMGSAILTLCFRLTLFSKEKIRNVS